MTTQSDAERLKKLYDARVPEGMSQEDFGKAFGIGSQSMVSQYLSGHRPLNYEAVVKFAKGLRCTIADISPEMAKFVRFELMPLVGRVALVLAAFGVPALMPTKAEAAFNITVSQVTHYLRRLFGWRRRAENT